MLLGHAFLIVSGIAYLTAWILNYGQLMFMSDASSAVFFNISVASGLIGCGWLFYSISSLNGSIHGKKLKILHIIIIGIVSFILVWMGTEKLMKRIFTSELFLIFSWGILEFSALYTCFHKQWFGNIQAKIIMALISVSLLTGLVCYCLHFIFKGMNRFINGMIPYGIISIIEALICIILLANHSSITGANAKK